jgi:hypothetical protein
MAGCPTLVHSFNKRTEFAGRFQSGVSPHSHTMHSKEYLGRLPTNIAKFPIGSYILEREIGRLHLCQKWVFDFDKSYWTPPPSPREAHKLESEQIEGRLGLRALVSLSDHDNIAAGMHLRMLEGTASAPIAVEWTVPFEDSQELVRRGLDDFRITIVGDGSEVAWLKRRLKHGEFTGVLRGEGLAGAYANMDLFVFPSRTDTFGNVVQEAAASGVPSVVTNEGGPKHLVVPGKTGLIAETNAEFVARVVEAARENVSGVSWDAAFEKTYRAYRACLPREAVESTVQKNMLPASAP